MWNEGNDTIMIILDNIENTCFPAECPVCQKKTGHIFFYRNRERYGGMWVWCSNCRNSSHTSGLVPEWWINPDFIDKTKLTAFPEILETDKLRIDKWVNMLTNSIITE